MASNTIITSVISGGVNSHTTVAEEANSISTDFVSQGVVGAITLNTGSGGTGSFCVNQDATPDMGVTVLAGQAYIKATPSSQDSQVLRARASANYTTYTINANSSGSTKYDWIYLQVNATNANVPDAGADNVTAIYTSRSTSNTSDTGSPPTYGLLLAVVTVANAASSITNSNITDKRFNTSIGAQNGSLIVTQSATGQPAVIQAAGQDANINVEILGKGTGGLMASTLYNPYKFSVYLSSAQAIGSATTAGVVFQSENFDTSSNYSTSTGKFTAPIAGFYQFNASCNFGAINGNYWAMILLYKNGSEILRGNQVEQGTSANVLGLSMSGLLQLAANDYIQVYWYNGDTVSRNINAGATLSYFQGYLVSAT